MQVDWTKIMTLHFWGIFYFTTYLCPVYVYVYVYVYVWTYTYTNGQMQMTEQLPLICELRDRRGP